MLSTVKGTNVRPKYPYMSLEPWEWDGNAMPTPNKRISIHSWIHHRSMYTPEYFEYRAFVHNGTYRHPTVEYYHDQAIAVVWPNHWKWLSEDKRTPDLFGESTVYDLQELEFYRLGCDHAAQRELTQQQSREIGVPHFGNCYHVYKCPTCGYTHSEDSSD